MAINVHFNVSVTSRDLQTSRLGLVSVSAIDVSFPSLVPRWRFLATFLRPAFPASRVQQVTDLHLKFALRPHHVWQYGRHPIYGR